MKMLGLLLIMLVVGFSVDVNIQPYKSYCLDNKTLVEEYKWVENSIPHNITVYKECFAACSNGTCSGELIKHVNALNILIVLGLGIIIYLLIKNFG